RGDWEKLSAADVRAEGTLDAPAGAKLTNLLSLDRIVAVGKGPGQLKVQVEGPVGGDKTLDVRLSANGLLAQGSGRGRVSQTQGSPVCRHHAGHRRRFAALAPTS